MARELAEGQVALLLLALGVAAFAGLLPIPFIDVAAAALLVVAGLAIVAVRPRGNRMLGYGIALLGVLLGVVAVDLDPAPAIRNALTTLVAAVLLVTAYVKWKGAR